jgi:hypothetical protein
MTECDTSKFRKDMPGRINERTEPCTVTALFNVLLEPDVVLKVLLDDMLPVSDMESSGVIVAVDAMLSLREIESLGMIVSTDSMLSLRGPKVPLKNELTCFLMVMRLIN